MSRATSGHRLAHELAGAQGGAVAGGRGLLREAPLTYWRRPVAHRVGSAPIAWAARLAQPAVCRPDRAGVGLLARRSAGGVAGMASAAAVSTFLLAYQVAIWLATDAPLLAAVSIALLGAYRGFYASGPGSACSATH